MKRQYGSTRLTLVLLLGVLAANANAAGCEAGAEQSRLGHGVLFANMGDYANAISEFKRSIACKPSADAYSNLGVAYLKQGKRNLALEALENAERLNAGDPYILYNLAATHSLNGAADLSLQYLDRALQQGFNEMDALRSDPDLIEVRSEPEFRKVLEKNRIFLQ